MTRFAALPALLLLAGLAACGGDDGPPAAPGDGPAGPVARIHIELPEAALPVLPFPDDVVRRDDAVGALRAALAPWVKAHDESEDLAGGIAAALPLRIEAEARWATLERLMMVAGLPDLRIWRFDVLDAATGVRHDLRMPRGSGLTDTGPQIDDVLLPVEYRTFTLTLMPDTTPETALPLRVTIDRRIWMERPKDPWSLRLPRSTHAAYREDVATALGTLARRLARTETDALALRVPDGVDLPAVEVLRFAAALDAHTELPVYWGDPSRGHD